MPTVAPAPAPVRGAPIWLGMLVLYFVWGSTYLGIAIAVDSIPPFLMAAVRFLIAGLVLLAWSIARDYAGASWCGTSPRTVQRRTTRRCVCGSYDVARCIRQRLSQTINSCGFQWCS